MFLLFKNVFNTKNVFKCLKGKKIIQAQARPTQSWRSGSNNEINYLRGLEHLPSNGDVSSLRGSALQRNSCMPVCLLLHWSRQ